MSKIEPAVASAVPSAQLTKFKRNLPWYLVVLVIVAAGVVAGLVAVQNFKLSKQLSDLKQNPQKIAEDQVKSLIDRVGQLMVLPTDEQPTVATVTDLKPLASQPFFANAQLGDKVLIYANAKKAILYRESMNKIIEVAPVNIGSNTNGIQSQNSNDSTAPVTKKKNP